MDSLLFLLLLGISGGVAVGIQGPLINILGMRLGTLESIFISHLGGAIFVSVPLLLVRGGNLMKWQSVPWYALCAGFFGLIISTAITNVMPRLGSTTTIVLVVVGQLITGVIIDHYGLLDNAVRTITLSRAAGVGVLLLGTYLIMR